jgi:hypothetical protein
MKRILRFYVFNRSYLHQNRSKDCGPDKNHKQISSIHIKMNHSTGAAISNIKKENNNHT